ncbi:MAG: type II CRISPR RNA-guided endonuclease Cas9 [Flavobacteriaceae bacterium]
MSTTLGLCISYNSIGWALIDKQLDEKILGMGVRVFHPNVIHIGEGMREQSTLAQRTHARFLRKISYRKRIRKQKLLAVLIQHKMCPLPKAALENWVQKGVFPKKELAAWLVLDPYELRAKATHSKLELIELGRIFYHIAQRRGKCYLAVESKQNHRTYYHGKPEVNRIGLSTTLKNLSENQTLGAYLASLKPVYGAPYQPMEARIRNRYLDRSMFVQEFHAIYSFQQQFYPQLSEELRFVLGGAKGTKNDEKSGVLFYQRPPKSPKTYKRFCSVEPRKKRTPISHPEYEIFQILKWINSIRCNGQPLDARQRACVMKVPLRFSQFSFKKIRKALDLEDQTVQFNYDDTEIISLAHTMVHLSKPAMFGASFLERPLEEQIQIWHTLYFFDDPVKIKTHAKEHWGCSEDQATQLSRLQLRVGYGSFSLKAVRMITPFLKLGMRFDQALFFGGFTSALGSQWKKISLKKRGHIIKDFSSFYFQAHRRIQWAEAIKSRLDTHFGITQFDDAMFYKYNRHLIHRQRLTLDTGVAADQHIKSKFKPIAHTAIFELRKLVNAVLEKHGRIDQMKVYVRPELKASRSSRKKQFVEKKRRATLQRYHLNAVHQLNINPTRLNVLKHQLWEEFDKQCPYTGEVIGLDQLFTEDVSVVHILPWRRFFNDSDNNKALCMRSFKHHIENKTPWEYFSNKPTGTWEQLKIRVLKQLMNANKYTALQKFKQFTRSNYALDAKDQELTDSHHVSLAIKNLLNQVCDTIQTTLGHTTYNLREKWYLDRLDNFLQSDPMHDMRRHAIDALVTAVKTPAFLEALKNWNRYEPSPQNTLFPLPWPHFKKDVQSAYERVQMSFPRPKKVLMSMPKVYFNKQEKRVARSPSARGQLHKELFYGRRKAPDTSDYAYHIRKPIQQILTAKHVQKIVDPEIKKRVYVQIDAMGGFDKGKLPKHCLTFQDEKGFTRSKITLPNRRGEEVPVNKVRVREQISNAIRLHHDKNVFANSRNNHHVLVYENIFGELDQEVVTFWTAVHRKKNKEPIWQLPDDGLRVVASLHPNDCFLMGLTDEEHAHWQQLPKSKLYEHLYRLQRISHRFYEFRHVFDANIYDTAFPNYIRILNFGKRKTGWMTYNPKKVFVDILGNLTDYKPFYIPNTQPQSQS